MKEFKTITEQIDILKSRGMIVGTEAATMLKLLGVALPNDVVRNMKKDIVGLLDKYKSNLHVITARDLRKQLGL